MQLPFVKYHGSGNDFILLDARTQHIQLSTEQISVLCSRHWGIGADGLIMLSAGDYAVDFEMLFFNPDGSTGMMCGNGGRCISAWADELGIGNGKLTFLNGNKTYHAEIKQGMNNTRLVKLSLPDMVLPEKYKEDYLLHTGAPHYVCKVSKKTFLDIPLVELSRDIRFNEPFLSQGGINVNYLAELEDNILFVRTYERGVEDETLSCGTGVTASALCYAYMKDIAEGKIHVHTKGGELDVFFQRKNDGFEHVFLEGAATNVFHGEVNIESLVIPPLVEI